jgi:hypothetical protein
VTRIDPTDRLICNHARIEVAAAIDGAGALLTSGRQVPPPLRAFIEYARDWTQAFESAIPSPYVIDGH